MSSLKRPRSLAQVADWSHSGREFDLNVADFLHQCMHALTFDSLAEEPQLLAERFPEGRIADCYLAAVAVELATQLGHPRPASPSIPSASAVCPGSPPRGLTCAPYCW